MALIGPYLYNHPSLPSHEVAAGSERFKHSVEPFLCHLIVDHLRKKRDFQERILPLDEVPARADELFGFFQHESERQFGAVGGYSLYPRIRLGCSDEITHFLSDFILMSLFSSRSCMRMSMIWVILDS